MKIELKGAGALLVLGVLEFCELEDGAAVVEVGVVLVLLLDEPEAVELPADDDDPSTASVVPDSDVAPDPPQTMFAHKLSSEVLVASSG